MRVFRPLLLPLLPVLALLGGCGSTDDATVAVAVIGDSERLTGEGTRLSPAGQLVRSATREGLVALGPDGEVLPAIAERWIVTDDGLSYIFRLRNSEWPDGTTISATDVRDRLKQNLARLRGTSLGLDLAPVAEIRAMTGRIEAGRTKRGVDKSPEVLTLARASFGSISASKAIPQRLS